MKKNVLITGGAGFIGRGLIKHLLHDKTVKKIIIFDNFISSNKLDFEKFQKEKDENKKVLFFECDITNLETMLLIENQELHFDEIYHLASLASPIFYKKYPLETLEVGYLGTKNILEIARKHKSKVLFSSTSEVYGNPTVFPQHEDYLGNVNSFGERACYDESKRVAESLCYTYIKKYKVDVKIARIFNTYGPEMMLNDGRIITEVIKNLINNTTLKIFGDGNQTRSCTFIDNTIDMLVKLMGSNCNIPVNIGNDEELTINETINIIENVYRKYCDKECKLKRENVKLTQDDPLKRRPCLKRNKEILGETKYINIKDGILLTIQSFLIKK